MVDELGGAGFISVAVGALSAQASALLAFYRCVEDPGGQSARQSGSTLLRHLMHKQM